LKAWQDSSLCIRCSANPNSKLSLRIPAELRNYLERAREVFASHKHEFLSTSDVGKLLLESAVDDRLDDRVEVADLRIRTAEAMWAIRCKWEQHQDLSRAEWIFLAQHVQTGCEELADDPELPRPESFAQVLEAFLAVRTLRRERGVELDRYYLGNLGLAGGAVLRQRQLDPDLVPQTVAVLVRQLRESTPPRKPVFVGRLSRHLQANPSKPLSRRSPSAPNACARNASTLPRTTCSKSPATAGRPPSTCAWWKPSPNRTFDTKLSRAIDRIHDVWQQTANSRSTQLVFCDLSTPDPSRFNVYDDLRSRLTASGIPQDEIAFIHDADSDAAKMNLFNAVNAGRVRVLIGSTEKMGAGTNVQRRLAALHHLDAPWRPRDIEQREGRILRQGNLNPEVRIYRYVTEGSFDAYMWQVLETKARFIQQVMSGQTSVRAAEDLEAGALTYAEIKAIASGNPAVMEKVKVDTEVR